ncbi:hypothetical protein LQZ18_18570 [Lachnospiraceae bacterium ZAX-1]
MQQEQYFPVDWHQLFISYMIGTKYGSYHRIHGTKKCAFLSESALQLLINYIRVTKKEGVLCQY